MELVSGHPTAYGVMPSLSSVSSSASKSTIAARDWALFHFLLSTICRPSNSFLFLTRPSIKMSFCEMEADLQVDCFAFRQKCRGALLSFFGCFQRPEDNVLRAIYLTSLVSTYKVTPSDCVLHARTQVPCLAVCTVCQ